MTLKRHILREHLLEKTIDVHTHAGIDLKAFGQIAFPYCSSIEGLYYRMKSHGVDYSVVFPASGAHLYFDIRQYLTTGKLVPAKRPIANTPVEIENRMLLTEIFNYCAELKDCFLPFVLVDPARRVKEQIEELRVLETKFPIYGLKVSPVSFQSKVTKLLEDGEVFLEFAAERDWPVIFHVTVSKGEEFSQASDTFRVLEQHPELRYCMAHCIGLHRGFLETADRMSNVWVDTAAQKILVELAYQNNDIVSLPPERLECDCSSHIKVMQKLTDLFPKTIIWGSDTPYYSYIVRRLQAEDRYVDFRCKGTYEDEVAALQALTVDKRKRISLNTMEFLFG